MHQLLLLKSESKDYRRSSNGLCSKFRSMGCWRLIVHKAVNVVHYTHLTRSILKCKTETDEISLKVFQQDFDSMNIL